MQDLFSFAANSVSNFRFPNCSKLRAGYVKRALICLRSIRACRAVVRLLPDEGGCFVGRNQTENQMAKQKTESKRLLSYVIAEWACSLRYENLSPEAIQAAKLFWFDSIGCALGGSQQEEAKILLEHHRAMGGGNGKATALVSGFKMNPGQAAFFDGHMNRESDYNDIYWKAQPCQASHRKA